MAKTSATRHSQLKPAILQKIFRNASKVYEPQHVERKGLQQSNQHSDRLSSQPKQPLNSSSKRFVKNSSLKSHPMASSEAGSPFKQDVQVSRKKRESQVEKLRNRLSVGQFRYISEQLYTQSSEGANELFREKPELFFAYQRGYSKQQISWPSNPLDAIISEISHEIKVIDERGSSSSPFVIADFGCGEARLARTVLASKSNAENASASSSALPTRTNVVIHSFDFVAANEHVIACDMAHTSLNDCSVDIVVFCLSLMGTNICDFLVEANRVLKQGGRLRVAEVRSRFESVAKFIKKLKRFGFKLIELRGTDAASFFTHFTFEKVSPVKRAGVELKLLPCIYKKR